MYKTSTIYQILLGIFSVSLLVTIIDTLYYYIGNNDITYFQNENK